MKVMQEGNDSTIAALLQEKRQVAAKKEEIECSFGPAPS